MGYLSKVKQCRYFGTELNGTTMGKKILIVDDEPEICELLSEGLEHAGYEVITATTGAKGFEHAEKDRPDLIILDICLPDIDGVVMYETLRGSRLHEKTPVIFLTGLAAGTDTRFTGPSDNQYTIIPKPANIEEIQSEISRLIG